MAETDVGVQNSEDIFMAMETAEMAETAVAEKEAEDLGELQRKRMEEIDRLLASQNLAEDLKKNDEELWRSLGAEVCDGFELDKSSRSEWEETYKNAVDLARQLKKKRQWGGETVADVRYPLLAQASLQFSSRAYPSIMGQGRLVKAVPFGRDQGGEKAGRADRISDHMTYQLMFEDDLWESDMDQLLICLPLMGCQIKKTYWDAVQRKVRSVLLDPEDFVIHYFAKNIETAYRKTHVLYLTKNEVIERQRAGLYLETDLGSPDKAKGGTGDKSQDEEAVDKWMFLEIHTFADLDDDGYEEPYVITVKYSSKEVVRISARFDSDGVDVNENGEIIRIKPVEYFTRYLFIPDEEGSFYGKGFGALLGPINETVNTILNQLIDAGSLANRGGGIISSALNIGKGNMGEVLKLAIGEWKIAEAPTDQIGNYIFPWPLKEPSGVLFQLLGLMMEAGEKLASVSDLLVGGPPVANEPATSVLARIEQGLKVFHAIYKRIYRSLKSEFTKVYRLNGLHLEEEKYFRFHDTEGIVAAKDYRLGDCDVWPVSDPNNTSDTQRLAKAQVLMELRGQGFDDKKILERFLQALNIDNYQELIPEQAPPNPQMIMAEIEKQKVEFEQRTETIKNAMEWVKIKSEVIYNRARAVKAIADAEAAEEGPQIQAYKAEIDAMSAVISAMDQMMNPQAMQQPGGGAGEQPMAGGQEGPEGLEGAPGNEVTVPGAGGEERPTPRVNEQGRVISPRPTGFDVQ